MNPIIEQKIIADHSTERKATLLPEGASVTDFLRSCEVGP